MTDTPTTKGRLVGTVADRRKPPRLGQHTDHIRLQQLRSLIADVLLDPHDHRARRDAGRMACTVGLILTPADDDRRELLLHLLGHAATQSPPKPSEHSPCHGPADDAASHHAGDAGG